jgi:hypothetical protein
MKQDPITICKDFVPNLYYYRTTRCLFCVEGYCGNWVPEKRICINLDPAAGSTYRVEPGHCKLKAHTNVTDES